MWVMRIYAIFLSIQFMFFCRYRLQYFSTSYKQQKILSYSFSNTYSYIFIILMNDFERCRIWLKLDEISKVTNLLPSILKTIPYIDLVVLLFYPVLSKWVNIFNERCLQTELFVHSGFINAFRNSDFHVNTLLYCLRKIAHIT